MPSIVLFCQDSDVLLLVQVVKHRADLATTLVSCGAAGALVDQVPCLQTLPPGTLAANSLAQPSSGSRVCADHVSCLWTPPKDWTHCKAHVSFASLQDVEVVARACLCRTGALHASLVWMC